MPKLTPQERRARIRNRLKQAEEPKGSVEQTTSDVATESKSAESESAQSGTSNSETTSVSAPTPPSNQSIRDRVLERRAQSRPPNYKLHVVTALSLALVIRILAFGSKAVFGGKQ